MGRPAADIRCRYRSPGIYLVGFLEEPGHEHQVEATSPAEARAWARRNRARLLAASGPALRLRPFLEGFFARSGAWVRRMEGKGHVYGDKYLLTRQGHLDNYIAPLFGDDDPLELSARVIDDRLLAAPRAHGGPALAPATKYKILYSFALVLADLAEQGVIPSNPLASIRNYSKAPVAPRSALPRDALVLLFPDRHPELVRVWGSSLWGALFLVLLDTGMRPGEARALRWREVYPGDRAIVVRHGIVAGTIGEIGDGKTGQVKAGGISPRTEQALAIWRMESRHSGDDDFIFTRTGAAPVSATGVIFAFRRGLEAVGLEGKGWTPYWLRHTFVTQAMATLDDKELPDLAGHTNIATNLKYRHPDDDTILRRSKRARDKLDRAREQ